MKRPTFGATTWDLIEAFCEAQRQYQRVYSNYETRVLAHAEQQAVDRHQLRLEAAEVSRLLDFVSLGELRNGPLLRTKAISHSLFRTKGRTHKFDRYISEIFHDLSILREEQYKVSTFAEDYKRDNELASLESLLDEVHEDFPRRVHNIWGLFQRAQLSLETVLRPHSRDPVYLRSLFLFGDQVLRHAYRRGRFAHCWRIFARGPAEADYLAAKSFAHSGFKTKALNAIDTALTVLEKGIPASAFNPCSEDDLEKLAIDLRALKVFIESRSPVELIQVESLANEGEVLLGNDAAPDVLNDFGSADEFEEASASDIGFI